LYSSPYIIRVIKSRRVRWAGHVAQVGQLRSAYNILVRKPKGKRPLREPRRGYEDNIKVDFKEGVRWIYVTQNRNQWWALANAVMNLWVP
jgi:hypothetical protein